MPGADAPRLIYTLIEPPPAKGALADHMRERAIEDPVVAQLSAEIARLESA
jgi:hypothetical protein